MVELNISLSKTSLKKLIELVKKNNPKAKTELIEKAFYLAKRAHSGQKRKSRKPFFVHPLRTAFILAENNAPSELITAALLHDVLEDTTVKAEQLNKIFGSEIALVVEGVTNFPTAEERNKRYADVGNLQKIIIATIKDRRILVLKLADKLDNARTIQHLEKSARKEYAKQLINFYAPLARQLGMYEVREQLRDAAFGVLKPKAFEKMKKKIDKKKKSVEKRMKSAIFILKKEFKKNKLKASFDLREKHLFEIHSKMGLRGKHFEEIYDFEVINVIMPTEKDCYTALGVVHNAFYPVPGKIKDYIAVPRTDLYQSIHTTVVGPKGNVMKIIIRTTKMDAVAKKGIIARWQYKDPKSDKLFAKKFSHLDELMERPSTSREFIEFAESLKTDFLERNTFVFTPKGEIKHIPREATVLDFAYHINENFGNRFKEAKVNSKRVPFWYELTTGDIVEIKTAKQPTVHRHWINFAKGRDTKRKIKKFLKKNSSLPHSTKTCCVDLDITAADRLGLLKEVAEVFAKNKIFIDSYNTSKGSKKGLAKARLAVEIKDSSKLKKTIKDLKRMPEIKEVAFAFRRKPIYSKQIDGFPG